MFMGEHFLTSNCKADSPSNFIINNKFQYYFATGITKMILIIKFNIYFMHCKTKFFRIIDKFR